VEDKRKRSKTTKKNHNGFLHRYVLWRLAYIERNCIKRELPGP
jgi:hypothetical protein